MIDLLKWDSEFFGRRIARYRHPRCGRDQAAALVAACRAQQIECAYILADIADTESIAALQEIGAYLADVRVTFGMPTGAFRPQHYQRPVTIRPATASDISTLKQIAGASHRDTRFYADRHFAPTHCDRLYELWIEKSCRGWADAVLVIEDDGGSAAGYVTCHKDAPPTGHIGLFAVGEASQRRGLGKTLIEAAATWFCGQGVGEMTVATQLRNVRALQFYAGAGLAIRDVAVWFHLWPPDPPGGGA